MSRRHVALPSIVLFVLIGSGLARAQSEVAARGGPVWEADAPMAAAATTCSQSSPPEMQRQFNRDSGARDGPPEPKNRFLSVTAGDPGQQQTIRVTWDAMPNWPGGHIALIGQQKWLLEPFQICESSGHFVGPQDIGPPNFCGPSPGQPQAWFWAARLTCDPLQSWFGDLAALADYCSGSGEACDPSGPNTCARGTCGVDGVIHLFDGGIVPSRRISLHVAQLATYSVQVIDGHCSLFDEVSYSDPLVVINPISGDVGATPGPCPLGPPNGNVTFAGDVTGALRKFGNMFCAPKKTRVDLGGPFPLGNVNFRVSIADVKSIVDAYGGVSFRFLAPDPCAVAERK